MDDNDDVDDDDDDVAHVVWWIHLLICNKYFHRKNDDLIESNLKLIQWNQVFPKYLEELIVFITCLGSLNYVGKVTIRSLWNGKLHSLCTQIILNRNISINMSAIITVSHAVQRKAG